MGSVFNKIGGAVKLITKSITANGTYNAASDNADGYSQVSVNVPLTTKSITANGIYNSSSDNAAGYSQVSVNVRSSLTLIWSGEASGDISIDLSGYNWIVLETKAYNGATGGLSLLQVGGSSGCASVYFPYQGSARGYVRAYQATTSGITPLTPLPDDGVYSFRIIKVYGIPNMV